MAEITPVAPIVTEVPKKSFPKWPLMAVFSFILGIASILVYQKFQPTRSNLVGPSPSVVVSPSPDMTANWQTYSNNYWQVSFKYPLEALKPCFNYTTEKEGIRFWGQNFSCPDGHDIFYKIGLVGYEPGKYQQPKEPMSVETISINGVTAQKETYVYDETDGPLFGIKRSIEVIFTLDKGTLVIQQLGNNPDEQKVFDLILYTFKFTD